MLWTCTRSNFGTPQSLRERSSCQRPSALPTVQILVAEKSRSRPVRLSRSPMTSSESPYIGDESTIAPPRSKKVCSTPRSIETRLHLCRLVAAALGYECFVQAEQRTAALGMVREILAKRLFRPGKVARAQQCRAERLPRRHIPCRGLVVGKSIFG